jgi:hypothetical protein
MTKKQGLILGITLGVVGVVVLCGGFIYLVFFLTRGPVEAADRFLGLLAEGKVKEAYASTASGFRNSTSEERFAALVRRWKLTDYRSSFWTSRKVENNTGSVEGTVTTRDGTIVPLRISCVREGDDWKVTEVRVEAGVGGPAEAVKVPADAEVRGLVRQTLLDFNQAVRAKDFKNLHAGISELWKEDISPQGLQQVFQTFIDNGVDIGGVADAVAVFDAPPRCDENSRLVLEGHYPTMPRQVYFRGQYVFEGGAWKLAGLKVEVRK